ncbi:pentapeptide repeat-containing protein [bacterium]|nr:pentapeptide repeat-containing protein [bacterium]
MVLEASDRRSALSEWLATEAPFPTLAEGALTHRYFLGESIDSLHAEKTQLEGVSFIQCAFEGGIWIESAFTGCEIVHTRFRHVYFEKVDFSKSLLQGVHFEHCVFVQCQFPEEKEGWVEQGCLRRTGQGPEKKAAAPAPLLASQTRESAPATAPEQPRPLDRFHEIER